MGNLQIFAFLIVITLAINNQKVIRTVNFEGFNTKQVTSIDVFNDESEGKPEITSYNVVVNATLYPNLIHIEVTQDGEILQLDRNPTYDNPELDILAYTCILETPIRPQTKGSIVVVEEYTHRKTAHPPTMKIKDTPKIMIYDNAYYQTFYHTSSMKSTFEFPHGSEILKFTEIKKAEEKSRAIRYGAYKDVAPFTSEHIFIHTTYRDPIPVLRNVTKEITVSHWDTIKVDEYVHMENEIAKLAGEFGRVDYNPFDVAYAISEVTCNLPLNAHHLYYVDPVGNVTTSHARREDDKVLFEFKPRFPIMGGWKATWN